VRRLEVGPVAAAVAVALLVTLAGCGGLPSGATSSPSETPAEPTPTAGGLFGTNPPSTPTPTPEPFDYTDPEADTLGWEGGYWHNESIDVDQSDGLSVGERRRLVNRTMARVERVRGLEFRRPVPVSVVSRAEYRNRTVGNASNASLSTATRLHQNVKWEATMMIGEDTDAVDVQAGNLGAGVAGYYSPTSGRVVLVAEGGPTDADAPPGTGEFRVDEVTLSQELFHALQDRRFDVSTNTTAATREAHNAMDGLVEGDGNYVDYLYEKRCGDTWTCERPVDDGSAEGDAPDVHVGLYQVSYQPYSDGVAFVRGHYRDGGWEAVDDLYDDPPASTEQTIHPDRYPTDDPANVTVTDRSGPDWHVPDAGPVDHAAFGEAGLFVTLWYPSYLESQAAGRPKTVVVPYRRHFNTDPSGGLDAVDPYEYDHPASDGWDGEMLVPYVTNESASTNETGYVWKTQWESPAEASEFRRAHADLLAYRNATVVDADGPGRAYRVPDDDPAGFGDAFRVVQSGSTVVVVNAPTVDALDDVRAPANE
jgi:hypothetical protein